MASTAAQRRGLQGTSKLRRKLRAMEKHVQSGIGDAVEDALKAVQADAIRFVAKDTGETASLIEYKQSSDRLTGVVGPGAKSAAVKKAAAGSAWATRSSKLSKVSKRKLMAFFKGYWLEFGTKGAPDRNIPPQPARPFMQPAWDGNRAWAIDRVKKEVSKQLKRVAGL